ncbi:MAG: DMT family transporter [Frankiaceae bacterium]|nr:DMT family transporter [Frankiaceae bacterium]MBV9870415.1 DMT family transporter [Frankiaceae bacterium]
MADVAHIAAVVPLAVGAGGAFALANVAQMLASRRVDVPDELSPHLLIRLLRDPLWLLGLLASIGGYLMQAVALFLAPVVLVQPLIVSELIFALPLAAWQAGKRLGRREWIGVVLVAAGLALFIIVGRPAGEGSDATASNWLFSGISGVGALVILISIGESRIGRPTVRASALAAAASICFGFLSILTRVVGHSFADHGIGALAYPEPYVLVVVAIGGLLLSQTAFRIAPLSISLPIIDVGEPAVASLLGVLILGETVHLGAGTLVAVALSGAAVLGGVALLDTSPLVRTSQEDISAELRARREAAEQPQ